MSKDLDSSSFETCFNVHYRTFTVEKAEACTLLFFSIETKTVRVFVSAVLRYSEQVLLKTLNAINKPLPAYLFSSIYNVQ
jgi:hypothetical protein